MRRASHDRFCGSWTSGNECSSGLCTFIIDIVRILPVLGLLFLCSFIDRTNVGNAKILGLQADTHMTDHEYAIGLCAFYATYIARYVNVDEVSARLKLTLYPANYRVISF